MVKQQIEALKDRVGDENFKKLAALDNPKMHEFISKYVELFEPSKVFVRTDDPADAEYIRKQAIKNGEEARLDIEGHTIHFDGYYDQGRDKANTKYLLEPDEVLGSDIVSEDREKGLKEIHEIFKGAMRGKEVYICFFCLGPTIPSSRSPRCR